MFEEIGPLFFTLDSGMYSIYCNLGKSISF